MRLWVGSIVIESLLSAFLIVSFIRNGVVKSSKFNKSWSHFVSGTVFKIPYTIVFLALGLSEDKPTYARLVSRYILISLLDVDKTMAFYSIKRSKIDSRFEGLKIALESFGTIALNALAYWVLLESVAGKPTNTNSNVKNIHVVFGLNLAIDIVMLLEGATEFRAPVPVTTTTTSN